MKCESGQAMQKIEIHSMPSGQAMQKIEIHSMPKEVSHTFSCSRRIVCRGSLFKTRAISTGC